MPLWISVLIVYNASLLSGQFDSENCSKPFLKKSINLDAFVLSNYQPISDLVLSSKVTERIVCCYRCEFWPVCFFQEAALIVSPSPQPELWRGFPSALLDTTLCWTPRLLPKAQSPRLVTSSSSPPGGGKERTGVSFLPLRDF